MVNYHKPLNEIPKVQLFLKENLDLKLRKSHSLMAHFQLCKPQAMKEAYVYTVKNHVYQIVFNGYLRNRFELKKRLLNLGYHFISTKDAEIILYSYLAWQEDCLNQLDGPFAFIIDDGAKLFMARDHLGIQPLYYLLDEQTFIASHEIKSLLKYQGQAVVDENGVKELLGLGPSLSPGKTIYQNIFSLRPAHYLIYDKNIIIKRYWRLEVHEHKDSLKKSIEHLKYLVEKSIASEIQNGKMACMLSGGLDSSIITAVASKYQFPMTTYSVSYEDQEKYFQSYAYQTSMDDDYIDEMIQLYETQHHSITLTQTALIDHLEEAMIARDMPGMADIDASLLLFSQEIQKQYSICLSGECADEIFGGYPWFYKKELYSLPYFPWMQDLDEKIALFNTKVQALDLKSYIQKAYQKSLMEIKNANRWQQLIYLNIEWFMQTLLTRAQTMALTSDLEIHVPFATKEIVEYIYNIPLTYLSQQTEEKELLRKAFEAILPPSIAHRKKNPYPKTHSPIYTDLIIKKLRESLNDQDNILYQLFDIQKLETLVKSKGQSFSLPWFGQLMTGPQLLAYLYQIYLWGKIYHIQLNF